MTCVAPDFMSYAATLGLRHVVCRHPGRRHIRRGPGEHPRP